MEFASILTRDEMKQIKGGGCEWSGCGTASSVFTCWYTECGIKYFGSNEAFECTDQVGESWKFAIDMCGASYG